MRLMPLALSIIVIAGPAAVAGKTARPDLIESKVSNNAVTRAPGGRFKVEDSAHNRGAGPAARSRTRYLLSPNAFRNKSDASLGTRRVGSLKPGNTDAGGKRVTIPDKTQPGSYFVIACADTFDRLTESREGNNCTTSDTQITVAEAGDTTPPDAPIITDTDPDSPSSSGSVNVVGTAEEGSTVEIFFGKKACQAGDDPEGEGTAAGFASPGLTVTVDDGTTPLSARAIDASDNVSECSDNFTYTRDSTPPAAPEIEGSTPTGPSNDNDPEFFGTAEAGSTVKLYTTSDCSGDPDASGSVATFEGEGITLHVEDDTTSDVRATATDALGNVSACSDPFTYEEDSSLPTAPQIQGTSPSNSSPRDDNEPEVFGSAPDGTTVHLFQSANCSGPPVASGSSTTFSSPGFTVQVEDDTTTSFSATATDTAGNVSSCSNAISYMESTPFQTESESNDTPGSANELIGSSPELRGSIATTDDVDYFAITVPAGGSVVAETFDTSETNCEGPDTELRLLKADGSTVLAYDDDGGILSCSKIDGEGSDAGARNLEGGTYYLAVTFWQDAGAYRMHVSISKPPSETEPNDSTTTADSMTRRYVRGSIWPQGDQDFYSVIVPADGKIVADTTDSSGDTCNGINTTLRLYEPDGDQIAQDDAGPGSCSSIDGTDTPAARHLTAGTYLVSVEDSGNNDPINDYLLQVRTGPSSTSEVEPNDNTTEAAARADDASPVSLTGDGSISGTVGSVTGKDVFEIDLAAPSVVRLESFDGTGRECTGGMTSTLRLMDSSGTQTRADAGSGISGCAALVVRLPGGVSYVSIEETGQDATIPAYVLETDVLDSSGSESEPNETTSTATDTTGSSFFVDGGHAAQSDVDFYEITVPEGASVRAEVIESESGETCESGGVDSLITLHDSSGAALVADDDDGRSQCSQIDGSGASPKDSAAHDLDAGTYYLSIEACPSPSCQVGERGVFDYRLAVTIR
jgi:hypothetical protein